MVIAADAGIFAGLNTKKAAQNAWVLRYFLHAGYLQNPAITRPEYLWPTWVGPTLEDARFSIFRRTNGNRVNDTEVASGHLTPQAALDARMTSYGLTLGDILPPGGNGG